VTTLPSGGGTRGRESVDDGVVDLARDRELVSRAQTGDGAAFDDLYARYRRRLYKVCLRRLRDPHEAEDVTQEAFARAWRALPSFGGDRRFYPWISVIAAHLCTDVLRRRNRLTTVAELHEGDIASTEDGGEELALAAVDSAIAAKALSRLSDRHQRILELREGSGWSYQQIAEHEGVGITAVETLLWRARQALKREFASIADVDSRKAGLLAGGLSLSALRRFLRRMARYTTTVGRHKTALVAMASTGAAAAVIVIAALSPTGSMPAAPVSAAPPALTRTASVAAPRPVLTSSAHSSGSCASSASGGGAGSPASTAGAMSSFPRTFSFAGLFPRSRADAPGPTLEGPAGFLGDPVYDVTATVVPPSPAVTVTVVPKAPDATATIGPTVGGVTDTDAPTDSGAGSTVAVR